MSKKKIRTDQNQEPSNSEIEMRWVDAWNDLYALIGNDEAVPCQLPDGTVISVEECKGWLQDSAYQGFLLHLEEGWVDGRRAVVASRTRQT